MTDEQKIKKTAVIAVIAGIQKYPPSSTLFLGKTTGESLIDQHAECAVNLLRVFVGGDGMSVVGCDDKPDK